MTDLSGTPAAAAIDTGEQTCETLIRNISQALEPLRPGELLAVRSCDPSAVLDLPAWCRMTGHGYLGSDDHETYATHYLRKRGQNNGKDDGIR